MNPRRLLAALTLSLPLAAPALAAPAAAGEVWFDDYDAAVAVAREQKKDLLVDFTGSDWCGWCIRLHKEVFGEEEFQKAVGEQFVLVALDYPRGDEAKALVPNPERNAELKNKYGIRGFPTVLLMDVEGDVFASTGYQAGGVEAYLKHLEEIAGPGRAALAATKEVIVAFEQAENAELKQAACAKAVEILGGLGPESALGERLVPAVMYAFEADPENESGLKLRAVQALLVSGQADETVRAAGLELDPKNEHGVREGVVQSLFLLVSDDDTARTALAALDEVSALGFQDKTLAFQLTFQAAMWCNGPLRDAERAKRYATAADAIGTEDEGARKMLDEILAG